MSHLYLFKTVSAPKLTADAFLMAMKDESLNTFQENMEQLLSKLKDETQRAKTLKEIDTMFDEQKKSANLETFKSAHHFNIVKVNVPESDYYQFYFQATFFPEDWSNTLKEALIKNQADIAGKKGIEVGSGSGYLSQFAVYDLGATSIDGFEFNHLANLNAQLNVALRDPQTDKLNFLDADALTRIDGKADPKDIDFIFACLPQILETDKPPQSEAEQTHQSLERLSHTVPAENEIDEKFNKVGLGLNAKFLKQAAEKYPDASVFVNLSGRIGDDIKHEMFSAYGYKGEKVHTNVFEQATTGEDGSRDISAFVKAESEGVECGFYAKIEKAPDGTTTLKEHISTEDAQNRLHSGDPVYHSLDVWRLTQA